MSTPFDPLPDAYRVRLDELRVAVAEIGLVLPGTVLDRYMPCGKPGCRCQAAPPLLHGPYCQWTYKVDAKTRTSRLHPDEARALRLWTAERRKLTLLNQRWDALGLEAAAEIHELLHR
ncbi:MAG: hypothetical protein FJ087_22715 [Deltaproteobacteria bacterium]|nr:hypothetical protein [Deltaproteobacteria bacterium]